MKLLVVDDSVALRRELIARLSEIAAISIVGEAESAAVAMALIRTRKPDVVVLDLQLKTGSGFDVLSATLMGPHVPKMIILSNLDDAFFRARCQQPHVLRFFDKSKEFEQAIALCRELANGGTFASVVAE